MKSVQFRGFGNLLGVVVVVVVVVAAPHYQLRSLKCQACLSRAQAEEGWCGTCLTHAKSSNML